jgi:ParB family transcriptional regulator, chromosome partitioning protein
MQLADDDQRRLSGAQLAARTAHHDLTTPLTLALGYSELLLEDPRLPPEQRVLAKEACASILTAATYLQRLSCIRRIVELDIGLPSGPVIDLDDDLDDYAEELQDRLACAIPLAAIQPSLHNPRRGIGDVAELADSLREHGLLQPVVVRQRAEGYELIAGHRRYSAAKLLGWTEIAAVVRDETDEQAYILTLVENLQREDLSPREEAAALEVLIRERGWTTRRVGQEIKRSHMYVSRRLRVFDDPVLAPLVLERGLPVSTAEELLRVANAKQRQELAQQAVDGRWERRQVRAALSLERSVPTGHHRELERLLRQLNSAMASMEHETLTPADQKLVRRTIAVLQRLT